MWNRDREEEPDFRLPEVPKSREEFEDRPEVPVQRSRGVPHILKKPRALTASSSRNLKTKLTKETSGLLQGQPLLPSYRRRSKVPPNYSAAIPYPPKWLKNLNHLPGASSCLQPSQSVVKKSNELSRTISTCAGDRFGQSMDYRAQEAHQEPFQMARSQKASQQAKFAHRQKQPSGSIPGSEMIYQSSIQPRSSAPTHRDHPIETCPPRSPVKITRSKVRAQPRAPFTSKIAQFPGMHCESAATMTIVQKAMSVCNPSNLAQCKQKSLHGCEISQSLDKSMRNLNFAPNQHLGIYWGSSAAIVEQSQSETRQNEGPRCQNLGQQLHNQPGVSSNQHRQGQASRCQKPVQQLYSDPGLSSTSYFPVVSSYHQNSYHHQQQHIQNLSGSSGSYQDLYRPVRAIPFDPYHRIHSATGSVSSSSDEFQDYGIEDPTTNIEDHGSRKRVFSRGTSSLSMASSTSQSPPKKPKRIRHRRKAKVEESSVELQPMRFENGINFESMKHWLEENVKPAVLESEIRKRDMARKFTK
ncbi:Protein CBG26560 [Caenorhabditis briggsae]|uniref:Protein CBG26560 n=1 Tax=Caenorhabditis briggsae TaxID=6238 RepID=B6IGZ4_CAEBR|nr:Protein CBG26560 [Caenorhabditis briggsae]CAR99174.1 Protein CBG26560 [Caenorhabditis briggsae]